MPKGRTALTALGLVVVVLIASCDRSRPSSSAPFSPSPGGSAAERTPLPSISQAAVAEAKAFREQFGLRSDDAWILAVLSDPTADREPYGVALTRDEIAELNQRLDDIEAIREAVVGYGQSHPDDWAGAYIDQQRGGILVAQFSRNVGTHRIALFSLVQPGAPLEVNGVRWSLKELNALAGRFDRQDPWFSTIPAVLYGSGPDVGTNRFDLEISTADPRAEGLVLEHFKLGTDILQVTIDGTGALLLERGTLRIRAVDKHGAGIPGIACAAYADVAGAYDSHPVPMPTTNDGGICLLQLPATGYWVRLEEGEGPPTVVGIGRAVVTPHSTTDLTIQVD